MSHTVTLIPGDAVSADITRCVQRLIEAAGVSIQWETVKAGRPAFEATGTSLPQEVIDSIERTRVALMGAFATPLGAGYQNPVVQLRQALDLFASVRPVKLLPGGPRRYEACDVVFIRETTEDVYSGIEHQVVPGVVQSIKITTRAACERIVKFAFEFTKASGRKKLTLIHKANIMKKSDGLFLRVGHEIAESYPEIVFEALIADNACMQLVRDPTRYDVMVAQNLFGDLISDLGAGIVGGMSHVYGKLANHTDMRVFEALHGIGNEPVGAGMANPLPLIRPATALLRHLGEDAAADRIDGAIAEALDGGIRTPDLGGAASTEVFIDTVIAAL